MSRCNAFTLSTLLAALAAAATLLASTGALASGPVATHPAMPAGFAGTAMDTDRFLVLPPASVRWTQVHAHPEHPAVQVRQRGSAGPDANHFVVQPPASVHWDVRQ